MAADLTQHRCKSCHYLTLARHCTDAAGCDLVRCTRCQSYGTLDGARWYHRDEAA